MFFLTRWLKGVLTHRSERLLETMAGVAITIALLASLGAFVTSSIQIMTRRAVSDVPVDWQVLTASGADQAAVQSAIRKTASCTALEPVGYADTAGFEAGSSGSGSSNATVQTTGPGKVLGIRTSYAAAFPGEIRWLTGARQGVWVAQQTAANLHVREGSTVTIRRVGLPPAQVRVDGVIDLPAADSLFQAIGIPRGTAPQAPPDNVLLMPDAQWHALFDPQFAVRPDTVKTQYHVRINRRLPTDPDDAYTEVTHMAHHLESQLAGSVTVGDNLAARLAAARSDALYAKALFLFLGLPGAILAMMLTTAVAASGGQHRLREQALLRTRGASILQVLHIETIEAAAAGIGGVLLGVIAAVLIAAFTGMAIDRTAWSWIIGAAVAGFILAQAAIVTPAWKQARYHTVAAANAPMRRTGAFLWRKLWLDVILLVLSGIEFWRTASTGYHVVLAPEGTPQISVHYEVFIAPLFLWIGGALLSVRLWERFLSGGRRTLSRWVRPIAGNLSDPVAASLIRQRFMLTRGIVLVALAVSFAVSTAVFNTTYNVQSRVDAELTNGADVQISGLTTAPPGDKLAELKALPGVVAAQPMIHRFAYVGHDLQDIYGVDPRYIGEATHMSNAFFEGGDARAALSSLEQHPDGVLVAEETRNDFQLQPGDTLNLRVQFAADHQYHVVPFHFVGVVREFPTAPKDSFLVVNAAYLVQKTGSDAKEIVLMRTGGDPTRVAKLARTVVASLPGAQVLDITAAQRTISSGLTFINLHGLTRIELLFAVVFVMAATGLILAIGLSERRRNFAILEALGAASRQKDAFIWSEALLMLLAGGATGALLGIGIAEILVKVLTGVFDPPPEHLYIPWGYMILLALAAAVSTAAAVYGAKLISRRPVVEELRNL